jgi:hypothetical protein
MGAAEVIPFEEVRASKQWRTLRQQLHERFDQWLDTLETQWHEPPSTLPEVTAMVWALRQQLTGGLTKTLVAHVHRGEHNRTQVSCLRCRVCRCGRYPLDEVLGLRAGRLQLDVQQAAADVAPELPYDTAATLFGRLTGLGVSSERRHTLTHQAAEGLMGSGGRTAS